MTRRSTLAGNAAVPPGLLRLSPGPIQVLCFYVGVSAVVPQYTTVRLGPMTGSLAVTIGLAFLGWRTLGSVARIRPYLGWAVLLACWSVISSVAAWNSGSLVATLIFSFWIVWLVPGLAGLITESRYRNALLLGWAAGAAVFALTASLRIVTGRAVFDIADDDLTGRLLGQNRNAVNLLLIFIVPFLVAGAGGRTLRVLRWPLAAMIGVWVVHSSGRAGILGLAVTLFVGALVQPGLSRRLQRILVVAVVGACAFTLTQEIGGQAAESTNRLLSFLEGERTDADDARELLLRKAWRLTLANPAFGVGFGRYEETFHPVVNEARSVRVRDLATALPPHNSYALYMSELGFPGIAALVGLFGALMISGARGLYDRTSRAAVTSFAGLLLLILFQSLNGPRLFLPMAVLLSTVLGREKRPTPEQARERAPADAG